MVKTHIEMRDIAVHVKGCVTRVQGLASGAAKRCQLQHDASLRLPGPYAMRWGQRVSDLLDCMI
jgi:hypothetical protein